MALGAGRPLLFLDVDGPLIPFGLPPEELPVYPGPRDDDSHPGLARINPEHGRRLAALSCELVWATAWEHEANEWVAPRIGLPQLAVVTWPSLSAADEDRDERIGLHWKTRTLIEWAAGRPFAWVDDEVTAVDRAWVRAHHPGPALLHRVDPRRGLAEDDFKVLGEWLLKAPGTPGH
jgi:hypothetical protein